MNKLYSQWYLPALRSHVKHLLEDP